MEEHTLKLGIFGIKKDLEKLEQCLQDLQVNFQILLVGVEELKESCKENEQDVSE